MSLGGHIWSAVLGGGGVLVVVPREGKYEVSMLRLLLLPACRHEANRAETAQHASYTFGAGGERMAGVAQLPPVRMCACFCFAAWRLHCFGLNPRALASCPSLLPRLPPVCCIPLMLLLLQTSACSSTH